MKIKYKLRMIYIEILGPYINFCEKSKKRMTWVKKKCFDDANVKVVS